MKQAHFQPAVEEAVPPHHDLAAIRVDRAQTELRHGRPVVMSASAPDAPLLLFAAVETLGNEALQHLHGWGGALRLLLTAERAQALLGADAADDCSLHVPGATGIEALQQLGAVNAGVINPGLLHDMRPATPNMRAALLLAKRARLTPALLVAELAPSSRGALTDALVLSVHEADVQHAQAGHRLRLRRVSDAHVPIAAHDDCTLVLFREAHGSAEHVAIIVGRPDLSEPVPVRLHSACLTGDLLGSLRCDCGDQLQRAIDHLAQAGGVLLYLAQEGRGTGLANKLRAYRLQDSGLDTIDADRHLGFRDDERDFGAAVAMLELLGIRRIRLLTNNPSKIDGLRRGGIDVVGRVALVAPANAHNARYIQTKRERAGHLGHTAA